LLKLPGLIPERYVPNPGVTLTSSDVDVGGYDVLIGGHGFRLATDTQFPYDRTTEPTTTHRYDSSLEPGEQSLSPIPWVKAQSSFHAGAGQANLEQGFTAFQYQAEQVEHIRYDMSQGVDVWTPHQVTRLPDTAFFNFGFTSSTMITATVAGVDYAIIGGAGGLYQAAWLAGPDAAPTVTAIDLSGATYGGAANCTVSSLATDGVNYYGVIQLTVVGSTPSILAFVVTGQIASAAAPVAIYDCPGTTGHTALTNLCTNPNFESNTTGWTARSTGSGHPVTIAQSTAQFHGGSQSGLVTSTGSSSFREGPLYTFNTVSGQTYTASAYVWVSASSPSVLCFQVGGSGTSGTSTTGTGAWQRVSVTITATASTSSVCFGFIPTATALTFYVDDVLITAGSAVNSYFDGSTAPDSNYVYSWSGTANASTSVATPNNPSAASGIVGWAKERLIACIANKLYELPINGVAAHTALPVAKYTHPNISWTFSSISDGPTAILASGQSGGQASILQFVLDTSGGTPVLSGGASIATFPPGELVFSLQSYLATYLAIGTSRGIRMGTFDTYTGALKYGPLVVTTTSPVLDVAGRDRFIYGSYSNQQPDGKTGLFRLDLTMIVDAGGRNAWAPDLRPPTTAPTGRGLVTGVGVLPAANRVLFITPEGIHVEGNGPGSDGDAWIRTSRIRYDTAENKLFKMGRIHGTLDVANIQVSAIIPFGTTTTSVGTFGFLPDGDPGEFRLPSGLNEWIQLQFDLIGAPCVLNSYQVKAIPAPVRQHLVTMTLNCFRNETDRYGLAVSDPEIPRQRYLNLRDLESSGMEFRYIEFTNNGPVVELAVIDQLSYRSFSRPTIDDDFGGYITVRLRLTET
jgi:hypothetical protein